MRHIIVRCCSPHIHVLRWQDTCQHSHAVYQQLRTGAGGSHIGPDDPMFAGLVHSRPGRMSTLPPGARFDPIGMGLPLQRRASRSSSCIQTSMQPTNTMVVRCQKMISQYVPAPMQHPPACLDRTLMILWDRRKQTVGMIWDLRRAAACLADGGLGRIHSEGSCDIVVSPLGSQSIRFVFWQIYHAEFSWWHSCTVVKSCIVCPSMMLLPK